MSVVTLTGRLERNDVEGGTWVLVVGRDRYVLTGAVPAALADRQVEVQGEADSGGFGLFMQGPQLRVRAVRPL